MWSQCKLNLAQIPYDDSWRLFAAFAQHLVVHEMEEIVTIKEV